MAEQESSQELPEQEELFTYLVSNFYSSAYIQMGKIANPITDEVEKDMEQAQFTIDLLDMLKEKTEGNLTEKEQNFLTRAIRELKMNYMEEKKKDQSGSAEGEDEDEKSEQSEGSRAQQRRNIVTPDEAVGGEKKDKDRDDSSNLWTP